MEKTVEIERSIIKKYKKPIWHRFIGGCKDYRLVNAGGPHRGVYFRRKGQLSACQMHAAAAKAQRRSV